MPFVQSGKPRLASSPLGGGDDVVDQVEAWQLASVVGVVGGGGKRKLLGGSVVDSIVRSGQALV